MAAFPYNCPPDAAHVLSIQDQSLRQPPRRILEIDDSSRHGVERDVPEFHRHFEYPGGIQIEDDGCAFYIRVIKMQGIGFTSIPDVNAVAKAFLVRSGYVSSKMLHASRAFLEEKFAAALDPASVGGRVIIDPHGHGCDQTQTKIGSADNLNFQNGEETVR